ncbi:MAG: hypothetical protein WBM41_18480 [Arenicellales bacterium]
MSYTALPQSLRGQQEQACGIEQLMFNVTKAPNRSDTGVTGILDKQFQH